MLCASAALVLPAVAAGGATADVVGATGVVQGTDEAAAGTSVTLITGDGLTVTRLEKGRLAIEASVAERADGAIPTFHQVQTADETYFIPSDAQPLINGGLVDRELFNVEALLAATQESGEVPALVVMDPGARDPLSAGTLSSLSDVTPLPSINGAALHLGEDEAADFWADLTTHTSKGSLGLNSTVSGVWLDEVVEVALQDSVPATNAPVAWEAGLDGAGTTVAVLDTGWDPEHPDLSGKVVNSAGFTEEGTDVDGHGHGTHVAATVAGTGGGSDGQRKGVAPGADLIVGKVLGDSGSGPTSGIIEGMEWAVANGADVVSMSLGGSPTDGTDPMSLAVDSLTESSGALFVIAAGNDGRDNYVNSPGAATQALTVGAMSNDGQLAWFSSRGPRIGDFAIKPEISGPGVDITAARAAGTNMGTPVDDLYTTASGTSMATPHVAGAAAIALQRHPEATPQEIKSLLVSTARPTDGFTVYQQGGGMVDAGQAATGAVSASPSPLNLGYFTYPYDDATPVTETVTLHNDSDADVELTLDLEVTSAAGDPAPEGMVTVSDEVVTLPANGTATADVTVDTTLGDFALYSGHLAGSADGTTVVNIPLGFYKEDERFTLEVEGFARDGDPASGTSFVDVINVEDVELFNSISTEFHDGVAQLRVPPGTYSLTAGLFSYDEAAEDPTDATDFSFVPHPEIQVTGDTSVTADAATANPVNVSVQTHDVDYAADGAPNIYTQVMRQDTNGVVTAHSVGDISLPMYAAPTDPVTLGEFEFNSRHIMVESEEQFSGDAMFDASFVESGTIPSSLDYTVTQPMLKKEFARNDNAFHGNGTDVIFAETRHHWRPHDRASVGFPRYSTGPHTRTDYVSAGDGRWSLNLDQAQEVLGDTNATIFSPTVTYAAGDHTEVSWYEGPFHPTIRDGSHGAANLPSVRDGDVLDMTVYGLGDAQLGHSGLTIWFSGLESQFRLFENGVLVGEGTRARGDFPVSPGPQELRMEFETASPPTEDWGLRSSQIDTAWTVQSEGGSPEILPMLLIDYDVPLTLHNTLPGRGRVWVNLDVRHQAGAVTAPLEAVEVWFSHDSGESWEEARVQSRGDGQHRAHYVPPRRGDSDVSIRVVARDTAGNAIEQEVINAFGRQP